MVAGLASFQIGGVPCWCEMKNGQQFGIYRGEDPRFKVVREELVAASGASLGFIHASLGAGRDLAPREAEALLRAAKLASLAVETRRLHAELVHRSEFDLLTKAHSRHFFERELDLMIDLADAGGAHFGLIFFDLDRFKKINDSFGHGVGDEYLKEVARRIKGQLRSQDRLARLGGDEFAVLVPSVNRRDDVEEIIVRLESSLANPILLDGQRLPVSASFGLAYYPDDGLTRKQLLEIADVAMYASKSGKRAKAGASA
jgi:diguanylate cyclase (GGDEF)-like protein